MSWTCHQCTFGHSDPSQQEYLACELCTTPRRPATPEPEPAPAPAPGAVAPEPEPAAFHTPPSKRGGGAGGGVGAGGGTGSGSGTKQDAWGALKPPSARDIVGPRKRRRGLDAPAALMDWLVVLDFEWTADNRRRMLPVAEITQFPSVPPACPPAATASLPARCNTHTRAHIRRAQCTRTFRGCWVRPQCTPNCPATACTRTAAALLLRLRPPRQVLVRLAPPSAAASVGSFDSFVRPTFNPKLTPFSIELTAITQVGAGPVHV